MNVTEALHQDTGNSLGKEATISGFLVVSDALIYLCKSESEHQEAILVLAPWLVPALVSEIDIAVGSMHLFSFPATVTGQVVESGLGLVPLAFYRVSHVSATVDGRVIELCA